MLIKLKTSRLNMIENIYNSWKDDRIITKEIILHGFKFCEITNNFYLNNDEYKLYDNYMFDLIDDGKFDILDDLGQELNVRENDFKEKIDSDEEEVEQVDKEEMDISNSINNLDNEFSNEVLNNMHNRLNEINSNEENDKMDIDN